MAKRQLNNHEILVVAIHLLGGDTNYVDTEDVAIRANALAPGRFAWKKHPSQINLEHVRVFLTDAKKDKNGRLVLGSHRLGWMLSERGMQFARDALVILGDTDLSRSPISKKESVWRHREEARLLMFASDMAAHAGTKEALSPLHAATVFRLNDYVMGPARERVVNRYMNAFGDHPQLGSLLRRLAQIALDN